MRILLLVFLAICTVALVTVDSSRLEFAFSSAVAAEVSAAGVKKEADTAEKAGGRMATKRHHARSCRYGRTHATGKCYQPKEGQFYRDPKTGDVEIKPVTKINTPWK